jgi:hypothetical protein
LKTEKLVIPRISDYLCLQPDYKSAALPTELHRQKGSALQ